MLNFQAPKNYFPNDFPSEPAAAKEMAEKLKEISKLYGDMFNLLPKEREELFSLISSGTELSPSAYLGEKRGMLKTFQFVTKTIWARFEFPRHGPH